MRNRLSSNEETRTKQARHPEVPHEIFYSCSHTELKKLYVIADFNPDGSSPDFIATRYVKKSYPCLSCRNKRSREQFMKENDLGV